MQNSNFMAAPESETFGFALLTSDRKISSGLFFYSFRYMEHMSQILTTSDSVSGSDIMPNFSSIASSSGRVNMVVELFYTCE